MSGYKLAPTRPTPEMVEAAKDAYMASGDMDLCELNKQTGGEV